MIRAIGPMAVGVILSLVGVASAAPIVTLFPGATDFRIASVTDVEIDGTAYDATFHHGISYASLAAGGTNPITFPTTSSAQVAANAIVNAINDAMIDDALLATSTNQFHIPYQAFLFRDRILSFGSQSSLRASPSSAPLEYVSATEDPQRNQSTSFASEAIVSFAPAGTTAPPTAAVPEPGSIISFGIGAMLLGVFWYQRQRKQNALLVS